MSVLFYIITSSVVLVITFLINNYIKNRRFWKLLDKIYGYKTLPLLGNAHQIGPTSEDLVRNTYELFKDAGYTTYKFILGNAIFVCLCDPDTVEVLLSSTKEINKSADYDFFKSWLGNGLLMSSGSKWRQRRKIITPTFHFKILEQFVKVFNDNGKILIEKLSTQKGKAFNIFPLVNHYALDVICEAAMGVTINAQTDGDSEYVKAVHSNCNLMSVRFLSFWKRIPFLYKFTLDNVKYSKNLRILHKMTNNVIQSRRNLLKEQIEKVRNGESFLENGDEFIKIRKRVAFLDLLLLSKLPDGSFLTDEDVREETDTFMFEGHDTTTSAIAFTIYELSKNPKVQQKALEEIISIVGENKDSDLTYDNLQAMKYLEMVIKEALRLYPSVPKYGRMLENDMELPDGTILPAGCRGVIDAFALGRNPKHFPNHEQFEPQRFSVDNVTGKNPYMSVPFSAGSRNCIGQKFAMLEMKSVLTKILLNFEITTSTECPKLRLASEAILKPLNGVHVVIRDRKLKS